LREEKRFFFEKKNQKTFDCSGFGFPGWSEAKFAKVFWFFFSKKNMLPCFAPPQQHCRGQA
jgi:hypothetical protein